MWAMKDDYIILVKKNWLKANKQTKQRKDLICSKKKEKKKKKQACF